MTQVIHIFESTKDPNMCIVLDTIRYLEMQSQWASWLACCEKKLSP